MTYRDLNRQGWDRLVAHGCRWTVPVTAADLPKATELLDPFGFLPMSEIETVLCIGSGGGQQGPLFASLGKRVTVLDLSPAQLDRDRKAAAELNLSVATVQGDMSELSNLVTERYDLVYQPVSSVYIPNVRSLYAELASHLTLKGYYYGTHWNPVYLQMPEVGEWDGEAYRLVFPQDRAEPVPQTTWLIGDREVEISVESFIHSLSDLIGGLCDAGFAICRFREADRGHSSAAPASFDHLSAYVPPSFTVFAQLR